MSDIQMPPTTKTSLSAAAPTVYPQFSTRSKRFVVFTSLLLFAVTFVMALPNRKAGPSDPLTVAAGQSVGAVLFAIAIAFGAYKGTKPPQPRVFIGVFSISAAFVLLSALS